jgi:hypothetical protein
MALYGAQPNSAAQGRKLVCTSIIAATQFSTQLQRISARSKELAKGFAAIMQYATALQRDPSMKDESESWKQAAFVRMLT